MRGCMEDEVTGGTDEYINPAYELWAARQVHRQHTETSNPNRRTTPGCCGGVGVCSLLTWATKVIEAHIPPTRPS